MSAIPPTNTIMGRLRITEVYVRYDGPRLFACVNNAGTTYLGLFADEDETSDTYIYSAVSPERFSQLRSGNLPLRIAFADPTEGGLFAVTTFTHDDTELLRWVPTEEIPEGWLPDPEVRLALATPTRRPLVPEELAIEASEINRTVVALELDGPWHTTEFPLSAMADIMSSVQDNVYALAQVVTDQKSSRGAVQRNILDRAELGFYDLRAASFAVLISSAPTGRLFEDPLVKQSLEELLDLVQSASSDDSLREALVRLHSRALTKYRDLLEELEDNNSGLTTILASPGADVRSAHLSLHDVERSLGLIRESLGSEILNETIEALLVGVNARTHVFELFDEAMDRRISGRSVERARDKEQGLTIGFRYRAFLHHEVDVVAATGEVRHRYRMYDIVPVQPSLALGNDEGK